MAAPDTGRLDDVRFNTIVHRLPRPKGGGAWLVRVYAGGRHVHSAEGGVSLQGGLEEAQRAMLRYCEENGAFVSGAPVGETGS